MSHVRCSNPESDVRCLPESFDFDDMLDIYCDYCGEPFITRLKPDKAVVKTKLNDEKNLKIHIKNGKSSVGWGTEFDFWLSRAGGDGDRIEIPNEQFIKEHATDGEYSIPTSLFLNAGKYKLEISTRPIFPDGYTEAKKNLTEKEIALLCSMSEPIEFEYNPVIPKVEVPRVLNFDSKDILLPCLIQFEHSDQIVVEMKLEKGGKEFCFESSTPSDNKNGKDGGCIYEIELAGDKLDPGEYEWKYRGKAVGTGGGQREDSDWKKGLPPLIIQSPPPAQRSGRGKFWALMTVLVLVLGVAIAGAVLFANHSPRYGQGAGTKASSIKRLKPKKKADKKKADKKKADKKKADKKKTDKKKTTR